MEREPLMITRNGDFVFVTNQRGITLQFCNKELAKQSDEEIIAYCSKVSSLNAKRREV